MPAPTWQALSLVLIDRSGERGTCSAVQEVEQAHGVPVLSIINMGNIIDYLEAADHAPPGALAAMRRYREHYGV